MGSLRIDRGDSSQRLEMSEGESVLEACLRQGVELDHSCGGMGSCTTCRVWVLEPVEGLPERNSVESEVAADRAFAKNERLACQLVVSGDLHCKVPSS